MLHICEVTQRCDQVIQLDTLIFLSLSYDHRLKHDNVLVQIWWNFSQNFHFSSQIMIWWYFSKSMIIRHQQQQKHAYLYERTVCLFTYQVHCRVDCVCIQVIPVSSWRVQLHHQALIYCPSVVDKKIEIETHTTPLESLKVLCI